MRSNLKQGIVAIGATVVLSGLAASQAQAGFVINLIPAAGMNPQALTGFQKAAGMWSALFSDDVTININVDFKSLDPGVLGQTDSTSQGFNYSAVRNALATDAKSADDALAVSHLQTGNALKFETNNSSGTAILDNDGSLNNTSLDLNTANAKVLGLMDAHDTGSDASITFSSDFNFDFNPNNGITAGQYDFVGVAAHEIGHALGFVSGVDIVDIASDPNAQVGPFDLNPFAVFSTLDLFRYSQARLTQNGLGVPDLTFGGSKYFSLDGGLTNIAQFSTGAFHGDGNQASHWKDGLGLGIMDPTAAPGEKISANLGLNDIRAFDAIGYDLKPTALAPEPATLGLLAFGLLGGVISRRRRRA